MSTRSSSTSSCSPKMVRSRSDVSRNDDTCSELTSACNGSDSTCKHCKVRWNQQQKYLKEAYELYGEVRSSLSIDRPRRSSQPFALPDRAVLLRRAGLSHCQDAVAEPRSSRHREPQEVSVENVERASVRVADGLRARCQVQQVVDRAVQARAGGVVDSLDALLFFPRVSCGPGLPG